MLYRIIKKKYKIVWTIGQFKFEYFGGSDVVNNLHLRAAILSNNLILLKFVGFHLCTRYLALLWIKKKQSQIWTKALIFQEVSLTQIYKASSKPLQRIWVRKLWLHHRFGSNVSVGIKLRLCDNSAADLYFYTSE